MRRHCIRWVSAVCPKAMAWVRRERMALLAGLAAGAVVVGLQLYSEREETRKDALSQLRLVAGRIHDQFRVAESLDASLASQISRDPAFGQHQLASYGRDVLPLLGDVGLLQYAPNGVIRDQYPFVPGPQIGLNLLTSSANTAASKKALATRQMVFQGPFVLRQGGEGVVFRRPVYATSNGTFMGFAGVLLDWDQFRKSLTAESGQHALDLAFEVKDSTGALYRSQDAPLLRQRGAVAYTQQWHDGAFTVLGVQAIRDPLRWLNYLFAFGAAATVVAAVLTLQQRQLRRQRHLSDVYQALFEQSLDAMGLLGADGVFLEGNPAAQSLYGVPDLATFLALRPTDVSPEYQADGVSSAVAAQQRIAEALADGRCSFEWMHLRLDTGEPWLASVRLQRIDFDDGPRLAVCVRDISEARQIGRAHV